MIRKSAMITALMFGWEGSAHKAKNNLPVLGHPPRHRTAARRSPYIGHYYISSDEQKNHDTAAQAG